MMFSYEINMNNYDKGYEGGLFMNRYHVKNLYKISFFYNFSAYYAKFK